MPIFLKEDSEKVTNKLVEIPKELVQKAKNVHANIGEKYPTAKGAKRIKKIATSGEDGKTYNKKKGEGEIVKGGGKIFMKASAIKKADHELRHTSNNPNNLNLISNGGYDFKNFYHDALRKVRTSVKEPEIVKKVKPNVKKDTSPKKDPMKPINLGKVEIKLENKKKVYVNEKHLLLLNNAK